MKIVITIATLVVLGMVFLWWKLYKKLPASLSQMVYGAIEWKCIFAAMLALFGGAAWFCFIDRMPENFQWLLWLTEVGLGIVAITPLTNKDNHTLHNIGAAVSSISITVLAVLLCPWSFFLWLLYILYTLFTNCNHKKLVAEITCGLVLVLMIILSPL